MLTVGSLCSGMLGIELGLSGIVETDLRWVSETDPHACRVLDVRAADVSNHGDLATFDWSQAEPVDVVTAGYPCQPFSSSGQRKGTDDPRHIWPHIAEAIRVLRPRLVVLENVRGHLALGAARVTGDLAALGYVGSSVCVRASGVGAPHHRDRWFAVAHAHQGTEYGQRPRPQSWQRGKAATDADGGGLQECPQQHGDAPSTAADGRSRRGHADGCCDATAAVGRHSPPEWWVSEHTDYRAAVARWERVLERAAPPPTVLTARGPRLNPKLPEWMLGLPDGWVTDILDRNPSLKVLGNGVCPQQCAYALSILCDRLGEVDAA